MTSFGAMTVATKGVADMFNVTGKDRYLSFLPMSHALERWIGEVGSIVFSQLNHLETDLTLMLLSVFLSTAVENYFLPIHWTHSWKICSAVSQPCS